MSIASELTALAANKAAIKAAIEAKNPSTMPTDALSQWPTSIASIGGGQVDFDAEVEYLTHPQGSYVDPGIIDTCGWFLFSIDLMFPSVESSYGFRCGVWRGQQANSHMVFSLSQAQLLYCFYNTAKGSNTLPVNQFVNISTSYNSGMHVIDSDFTIAPGMTTAYTPGNFIIGGLTDLSLGETVPSEAPSFSCREVVFSSPVATRTLVPVRKNGVGYYYDALTNALYGSETSVALVPGPDKS